MSDRLEQLKDLLSKYYDSEDGFEQTDLAIEIIQGHVNWLIEQAERVQELERVNKQLKSNLSVYKGYYKNMIKINEDIVEENKKYRELIKGMGQEIEVLTDVMSSADNADKLNEEVIRLKGKMEESK